MDKKVVSRSSQHKVLCVAVNNLASHITCVCIHNKQSLPVEFVVLLPNMAVLFKYIQQLLISQPYFTDFSVFQIMLHNKWFCLAALTQHHITQRNELISSGDGRPFGHIQTWAEKWRGCCAPWALSMVGSWSPSSSIAWVRPTFVPSGILIYPTVWP